MALPQNRTDEETASALLAAFLEFVALCIEDPCAAAFQVALFASLSGMMVSYMAALLGQPSFAGFALAYIASGWTLYFFFRTRPRETGHAG